MHELRAVPVLAADAIARVLQRERAPRGDRAESLLWRDGLRGLTLRAIAREAGVSHTAPQHHFGDTVGVLSELAATGHRRLAATMARHAADIAPDKARRKAIARGYVSFAVNHSDLFRLMSRNELLDQTRPSLVEGRQISMRGLGGVFDDDQLQAPNEAKALGRPDAAQAVAIAAAWAYVHGLAVCNLPFGARMKVPLNGCSTSEPDDDLCVQFGQSRHSSIAFRQAAVRRFPAVQTSTAVAYHDGHSRSAAALRDRTN